MCLTIDNPMILLMIKKKLQELLRLGTPAALEQANDLMKVMSGYVSLCCLILFHLFNFVICFVTMF